ncbi:MAG TPA: [cytidine(C)-cytidine(C)-adenosine (A)]-adding enzyme, partial [Cyanobacteria bacterium UBA11148]|nr:[cytidine(C)-cytidine(C)-adenosine (A)]-adding enzyme [Cyanobacteria bacterium UBA11148]
HSEMSLREQYFFFQNVGSVFPALVFLAIAEGMGVEAIASLINRYLTPEDQVAHPTPLVTGNELMKTLNLPSGKQVGQLLTEIQIARIEGKIASGDEGIELAAQLINSQGMANC